jgi:hypothetical protein
LNQHVRHPYPIAELSIIFLMHLDLDLWSYVFFTTWILGWMFLRSQISDSGFSPFLGEIFLDYLQSLMLSLWTGLHLKLTPENLSNKKKVSFLLRPPLFT